MCPRGMPTTHTHKRDALYFSVHAYVSASGLRFTPARLNHSSRPPPPLSKNNQIVSTHPPASNNLHGGGEGADAGSALQATTGGRDEHGGVWLGRLLLAVVVLCCVETYPLVLITTVSGEVGKDRLWRQPLIFSLLRLLYSALHNATTAEPRASKK